MLGALRIGLAEELEYHCYDHTLDVIAASERIGRAMGVSDHEMALLKTAAAFHDCGFLNSYQEHEREGCSIMQDVLPRFGYDDDSMKQLREMVLATRVPQQPKDLLSKILCDADLEYLGGERYEEIASKLFRELKSNGSSMDDEQWLEVQIEFLKNHEYWTDYAKTHLVQGKEATIDRLSERVDRS